MIDFMIILAAGIVLDLLHPWLEVAYPWLT
jgi:hypothetical protein